MIALEVWEIRKGMAQFFALAIVATRAVSEIRDDTECEEVVENVTCRPGLASHLNDVVDGESGFKRDFRSGGIDLQVTVQAEIAEYAKAKVRVSARDGVEAVGVHACWSSW